MYTNQYQKDFVSPRPKSYQQMPASSNFASMNHGHSHSNFFANNSYQQLSRTIFLGDLSIYCTEKDICQLFSSFGAIESIHLKRIPQGHSHFLSYGFIRYQTRQSAEHSLASLDGVVFLGRPLR
jgi:RNA recognition motif-containing protein